MKYILCPISKAIENGFSKLGRITNGKELFLNEKEVMNAPALKGTLTARAKTLCGTVLTDTEAMKVKNIDETWKI